MSPAFGRYVNNVSVIAPKPTTFKIDLINGQDFSIKYLGKGKFSTKVAGKRYNPVNLAELESASQSIADLLELNYAPSEGKENIADTGSPSAEELGPELTAANAEIAAAPPPTEVPAAETPPAETPPTEETPPAEA
jgi:hypothetical protein